MILLPSAHAASLLPDDLTLLQAAGVQVVEVLPPEGAHLALTRSPGGLWGLHDPSVKRGAVLRPDFLDAALQRRVRATWQAHEPLRNAIGAPKGESWSVVDATCGLGRDAWMIAAWGHRVQTYERHPVLAWLVRGAWQAAGAPPSPTPHHGDARTCTEVARVVYLDPMFPETRKSALPSGELQLLRRLLADDEGPDDLLPWALAHATHRVVVKRPRHAPPLPGPRAPSFQLEGQTTRCDVYVR